MPQNLYLILKHWVRGVSELKSSEFHWGSKPLRFTCYVAQIQRSETYSRTTYWQASALRFLYFVLLYWACTVAGAFIMTSEARDRRQKRAEPSQQVIASVGVCEPGLTIVAISSMRKTGNASFGAGLHCFCRLQVDTGEGWRRCSTTMEHQSASWATFS